jgi:hypothetical protein
MTSLVKDLSDGVRLIQLMVRLSHQLLAALFPILTENIYLPLGDHGYVVSAVFNDPDEIDVLYTQVIPPLAATTGTRACVCRKRRT